METPYRRPTQTAFNSVVSTYQNLFNNNVTVNINVNFGNTSLGMSDTFWQPCLTPIGDRNARHANANPRTRTR